MAASSAAPTLYLPEIIGHTRALVARQKPLADFPALERAAAAHIPRGFARALRARAAHGPAIIAELKKASPSKGQIRPNFNPVELAPQLEAAGAAVLSVLTDERFFAGSLTFLEQASAMVSIPCLRKDFIVDEFQILEARAHHADAVLLIVAALSDGELRRLRDTASRYELDVLCEVHDRDELHRALDLGCECVGVNSRDLKTFQVSLDRAVELAAELPSTSVKVAESGIGNRADIDRLRAAGFDAFLIGETLMRANQPGKALKSLLTDAHPYVDKDLR